MPHCQQTHITILTTMKQSHVYNSGASMDRLDDLLSRNEAIYQNLKEKLEGINRSNHNIYRNIHQIHSNYHDPFSGESSAVEKERELRPVNTAYASRTEQERRKRSVGQVGEMEERTVEEMMKQRARTNEFQVLLEQQKSIREQQVMEEERIRLLRENQLYFKKEKAYYESLVEEEQHSSNIYEIQNKILSESIKQNTLENMLPSIRQELNEVRAQEEQNKAHQSQNGPKNNSIYLSQVPKTVTEEEGADIPTFREMPDDGIHQLEYPHQDMDDYRQMSGRIRENSMPEHDRRPWEQFEEKEREFKRTVTILKPEKVEAPMRLNSDREEEYIDPLGQSYKSPLIQSQKIDIHKGDYDFPAAETPSARQDSISIKRSSTAKSQKQNIDMSRYSGQMHSRDPMPSPPRQDLTSQIRLKIEPVELVPECWLFAPFNKVYRSPILQLKNGTVMLERKSKTHPLQVTHRSNILDPIKYKIRNVMTDEQQMLRILFPGENGQDCGPMLRKVAVVGGRQCLKKKLHMGLIAYAYQLILSRVDNFHKGMVIQMTHQEVVPGEQPQNYDFETQVRAECLKLALMKLDKAVEDIYNVIKRVPARRGYRKVLRMTKISILAEGSTDWGLTIVTTNRYDPDFLRHLQINKICWSINPLVKNYDEVRATLDSMKQILCTRRNK